MFGQFSLLTEESPTSTVRAHEDTLCYLIGPDVADEVLGTSAGQAVRARERCGERVGRGVRVLGAAGSAPFRRSVGSSAATPSPPTRGCRWRSGRADDRRARLVPAGPDARRLGHRHGPRPALAGAGVAAGARTAPLEEIATFPVKTLAPRTRCVGEALLAMFAEGVHHFPVTDGDGSIAGVVTDTDLMDIGRAHPVRDQAARSSAPQTRDEAVAAAAATSRRWSARWSMRAPTRSASAASWRSSWTR